jgi:outer membrane immunogenic protein
LFLDNRTTDFKAPGGLVFATDRINGDADLIMARINYRFGGYGAPVAARY